MVSAGTVVWAPDPFKPGQGTPRPWLVLSGDTLPYADEESIAVALTTQTHHPGSLAVPRNAWVKGDPKQRSHVLPWTVATLKHAVHVVGRQGTLTESFTDDVRTATISYLHSSQATGAAGR